LGGASTIAEPGVDFGHRRDMSVSSLGGRKGMERSSFKLSGAIIFVCFGLNLLKLLKTNNYNMKIKNKA
jgi:hypothetical protein